MEGSPLEVFQLIMLKHCESGIKFWKPACQLRLWKGSIRVCMEYALMVKRTSRGVHKTRATKDHNRLVSLLGTTPTGIRQPRNQALLLSLIYKVAIDYDNALKNRV